MEENTKLCKKCNTIKKVSEFRKNPRGKNGIDFKCIECNREYQRQDRKNNLEKWASYHRKYRQQNKERYNTYDRSQKEKYTKTIKGYASRLYSGSKSRAKNKNLEFNLTTEWVHSKVLPLICEATGFELNINTGKNCKTNPLQPTLDRIDPTKGYTIDNTRVTCWWWNVMKQDWSDEIIINLINEYKRKNND